MTPPPFRTILLWHAKIRGSAVVIPRGKICFTLGNNPIKKVSSSGSGENKEYARQECKEARNKIRKRVERKGGSRNCIPQIQHWIHRKEGESLFAMRGMFSV